SSRSKTLSIGSLSPTMPKRIGTGASRSKAAPGAGAAARSSSLTSAGSSPSSPAARASATSSVRRARSASRSRGEPISNARGKHARATLATRGSVRARSGLADHAQLGVLQEQHLGAVGREAHGRARVDARALQALDRAAAEVIVLDAVAGGQHRRARGGRVVAQSVVLVLQGGRL